MGIKIDDDPFGEESRRARTKRWDAYAQYLNDVDRQQETQRDEGLKTDASSRRQATEMDARPQLLPPAAAPLATDVVQKAPGARDWMSGIKRVGAAQEAMRTRGPDLNAATADSERAAKRVHAHLTDIFGDEAEMMERIDAQLVGFVERKQLNGGRERAAYMKQLLDVRSALVSQAERDNARDATATSKLATYRQWSSSVVGSAEAKIKNALG